MPVNNAIISKIGPPLFFEGREEKLNKMVELKVTVNEGSENTPLQQKVANKKLKKNI